MIVDTHAHIDFDCYKDKLDEVLSEAKKNGVEKIIVPAVEPGGYERVLELASKYPDLYCAIGLHPSEAKQFNNEVRDEILRLAKGEKVAAIGECGLDYYWDKSFAAKQKEAFIAQIEIANELKKTLIVHDRDAHFDTFEILKSHRNPVVNVVMHCFSGSSEFALQCVKEGFFIAVGGVLTFKNAKKMHEVVEKVPLEFLLSETDSPYLTPEPYRGKENQPAYTKFVVEKIAEIKNLPLSEVEKVLYDNAMRAFRL